MRIGGGWEVGGAELVVAQYPLRFERVVCVGAGAGEGAEVAGEEVDGEGACGGEDGEEGREE